MFVQAVRQKRKHTAGIRHHDSRNGHAGGDFLQGLHYQRRGSGIDGLSDELMPVELPAPDTDKQRARSDAS